MALAVNVKHDLRRLEVALAEYPRQLKAGAVRALNRTMTTVRKNAVNKLRAVMGDLKVGTLNRQIKLMAARSNNMTASLTFSASRFRLSNFGASQTRTGVRLRRMPWQLETLDGDPISADMLRHAFLRRARVNKQAIHAWIRVGQSRYPITALLAPSLAEALVKRGIGSFLVAMGNARFAEVIGQEMKYRLGKLQK